MDSNIIFSFTTILTQLGSIAALVISLFYLHNQNRAERIVSDNRWAELKTSADNRFAKIDERWLATEEKILKIMTKLEMNN